VYQGTNLFVPSRLQSALNGNNINLFSLLPQAGAQQSGAP